MADERSPIEENSIQTEDHAKMENGHVEDSTKTKPAKKRKMEEISDDAVQQILRNAEIKRMTTSLRTTHEKSETRVNYLTKLIERFNESGALNGEDMVAIKKTLMIFWQIESQANNLRRKCLSRTVYGQNIMASIERNRETKKKNEIEKKKLQKLIKQSEAEKKSPKQPTIENSGKSESNSENISEIIEEEVKSLWNLDEPITVDDNDLYENFF